MTALVQDDDRADEVLQVHIGRRVLAHDQALDRSGWWNEFTPAFFFKQSC